MTFEAPKEVFDLLKLREGWRISVYRDSLGKPTVGMGHLLTDEEFEEYPIGAVVPENVLQGWSAKDVQKAYSAAFNQCELLHLTDQNFVNVLTSVNFQLGTNWHSKFPKTWMLLCAKKWDEACTEVKKSAWYEETPVRVEDFVSAIQSLKK